MLEKITNLVKQMHKAEQKELLQHIEAQYGLEEKNGMLRDDISFKIRELLEANHTWLKEVQEEDNLQELDLDAVDITAFADTLLLEFELDQIEFSQIMEWPTVKDIVNYIEEALENRIGECDEEDNK